MKIELPNSFEDLTIKDLVTLHTSPSDEVCLMNLCVIHREDLLTLPKRLLDEAYEHLKDLRSQESGQHLTRLTLDGKPYGFINDWDSFSFGEYIDMTTYAEDVYANATKMMALLYRPIVIDRGDTYTIEPYTTKENHHIFELAPATLFGGAMLFFCNSKRRLLSSLRVSLQQTITQVSLATSGDGIQLSTPLQMKTS